MDDDDSELLTEWPDLPQVSLPAAVAAGQRERLMAKMFGPDRQQGVSLRTWLTSRSHSRQEILDLFASAGEALALAHADGRVRGFGLDTVIVRPSGSVSIPNDPSGSVRSDQFAFCAALWEALYGQPPFPSPTPGPLVPTGAWIPSWVQAALERGLQRDPQLRHESMSALLDALSDWGSKRRCHHQSPHEAVPPTSIVR